MTTEEVKQSIEDAAAALIEEGNGDIDAITTRMIAARAGVGIGLINYHYGTKQKLIELCVQKIIATVIRTFKPEEMAGLSPTARLQHTANAVMDFLVANPQVSRISILGDLHDPTGADNTVKTAHGFLYVLSDNGMPEAERWQRVLSLTYAMQGAFLRKSVAVELLGFDFMDADARHVWLASLVSALFEEALG